MKNPETKSTKNNAQIKDLLNRSLLMSLITFGIFLFYLKIGDDIALSFSIGGACIASFNLAIYPLYKAIFIKIEEDE